MKFDLLFQETYPQRPERVWRALTTNEGLSSWLNPTSGFEPVVGCHFEMHCPRDDGSVDVYHCEVLELDPPRRMLWSWLLEQPGDPPPTRVEFRLEPVGSGTRLFVRHSGDRSEEVARRFRDGWPTKLASLGETLGGDRP